MGTSTPSKRRLATIALIAGALTVLVPVAQAESGSQGSPDVVDRAVAARQAETRFLGSPDAIDRAVAAKQAQKLSAIDARERGMVERPAHHSVPPDAFERALITHADAVTSQTVSMLNSRERGLGERPGSVVSVPSTVVERILAQERGRAADLGLLRPSGIRGETAGASGAFDWSDFGVGAGAGLMLGLLVLAGGVITIRRSHRHVTTA